MWVYLILAGLACGLLPFACLHRFLHSEDRPLDSLMPVSRRQAKVFVLLFLVLIGTRITIHSLLAKHGFYDGNFGTPAAVQPAVPPEPGVEQVTYLDVSVYEAVLVYSMLITWVLAVAALVLFGLTVLVRLARGRFRPCSATVLSWMSVGFVLGGAAFWAAFMIVLIRMTDLEAPTRMGITEFPF